MSDESTYRGALDGAADVDPAVQSPYYGVHGWLKFTVIVDMYIVPAVFLFFYLTLAVLLIVAQDIYRGILPPTIIQGVGGAFFVTWGVLVACQLRDIKPRAVQKYKTFLIAGAIYSIPLNVLTYKFVSEPEGESVARTLVVIVLGLISAAIWYRYFCASKRVRATYPDWNE